MKQLSGDSFSNHGAYSNLITGEFRIMHTIIDDIELIDQTIRTFPWLDMSLYNYEPDVLEIIGSMSESYPYDIKLRFVDVLYLNLRREWHTNTKEVVISEINDKQLNISKTIEIGYRTFKIIAEDIHEPFYIVAKRVELEIAS